MFACMCICITSKVRRGSWIPQNWVGCELPCVVTENQTWILCGSSQCSWPLGSLCSSVLFFCSLSFAHCSSIFVSYVFFSKKSFLPSETPSQEPLDFTGYHILSGSQLQKPRFVDIHVLSLQHSLAMVAAYTERTNKAVRFTSAIPRYFLYLSYSKVMCCVALW